VACENKMDCNSNRTTGLIIMKLRFLTKYLISINVILVILASFLCYAEEVESTELPTVAFSLNGLNPYNNKTLASFDLQIFIYNPTDQEIFLGKIEIEFYFSGKLISKEVIDKEHGWDVVSWFPHRTDNMGIGSTVDLTSVNEKTREKAFTNVNEWFIKGIAYFGTSYEGPFTEKVPIIWLEKRSLCEIRLKVVDEKWNAVSNATILFAFPGGRFGGITDKSGEVSGIEIPTMNYIIKVLKEGYLPHEETLNLSTPSTVGKVIQIYRGIKLRLEIINEKGNPIKDANITFSSKDVGNFSKATNASGIAEFEIPRTNYTLSVTKKGYLPYKEVLDLSKSPIESKVIQLNPELTWLEQHWLYLIIGVIVLCIIIVPIVLRLKRRF